MLFPFLYCGDDLSEQIRCPVHGFIRYSTKERQIIDDPAFQRLRNIRQLALCHYVYPGAVHSRFEHSLGVMEMATRAFEVLQMKQRNVGLLEEELGQIPQLKSDTLRRALQTIRLLALLHDIGHSAFSHAAESTLPAGKKHEQISIHVINTVLREKLEVLFFEGVANLLIRILNNSPEVIFLRQFVVGEMDMDRTDYLLRDSLHCGVEYGRFDFRRLLESLAVLRHPDTGRLQIGIERGGEHTFEGLILARYQMNTQVYFHKVRRIYDHYLTEYMKLWAAENYRSEDDVLRFDDLKLLSQMSEDSANPASPRREFAARIINRRHHKVVYETGDSADVLQLRKAKKILQALTEEYKSVDFWLDDNARGSIHRLTTRGQQEDTKVEDFFILEKSGHITLITDDSAILEKIPREFRSVRIHADGDAATIEKISKAAVEIAKV